MSEVISIVTSVYNGAIFLDNYFRNISNQTYKNLNVILVNDGSTDDFDDVCDKCLKKYGIKIDVYDIEHKGVSYARNYGIKKATGNYIAFVDIDDSISNDYIERLYLKIKNEKFDIACCNGYDIDEKGARINSFRLFNKEYKEISFNDAVRAFLNDDLQTKESFANCLHGKLFTKKVIKNIAFNEELSMFEDSLFMLQVFNKNQKTSCELFDGYQYVRHKKSSVKNMNKVRKFINEFVVYDYLYCNISHLNKDNQHNLIVNIVSLIKSSIREDLFTNSDNRLKNVIDNHIKEIRKEEICLKDRVILYLYENNPKLLKKYYLIRKIS